MPIHPIRVVLLLLIFLVQVAGLRGDELQKALDSQLARAGDNRPQIEAALQKAANEEKEGMRFLVAYMPERDLKSLKTDFLVENVHLAYKAWHNAPWKEKIPREVFLNYVLPYANINERRDNWRKDFQERFHPLVTEAKTPGQAGQMLNEKIFSLLKVRFSTKRPKADQSPYETIEAGMASCTGLSILLVDVCRAVGVPARFVGTPLWTDQSGNHSWVEIWDGGDWHFTGAAEPAGLNRAWFVNRAAAAKRDDLLHAIYAVRYKPTAQRFPMLWAPDADYVYAVNVTDRYTRPAEKLADGEIRFRFRVLRKPGGERVAANLSLTDNAGKIFYEGQTRDERFDGNDHLEVTLKKNARYRAEIRHLDQVLLADIDAKENEQLVTFDLAKAEPKIPARQRLDVEDEKFLSSPEGKKLFASLNEYFAAPPEKRTEVKFDPELDKLVFLRSSTIRKLAWLAYSQGHEANSLKEDARQNRATYKHYVSPYVVRAVGSMPKNGWPLFIAMHGGGGAPKEVNDSQWKVMQIYYRDQTEVGGYLYLAIRAPNDAWNGFYDSYNLPLTEAVIRQFLLFGNVDPNKVYLMGYSHGGYGAFFIGPQLADRFAAVHASAAAPATGNEVGKNLCNTRFTYMIGEHDTRYGRIGRCQAFDKYIAELRGDRRDVYPVTMEYIKGAQHTGLPDRDKIKDMYPFVRNVVPSAVRWQTTDNLVKSLNWLHIPSPGGGKEVTATCRNNQLKVEASNLDEVHVYLDERLIDYSKVLAIDARGEEMSRQISPSLRTLCETLAERGDPELMFATRVELSLKPRPVEAKK